MKRILSTLLVAALCMAAAAATYSAQTLPEIDDYTRVSNPDGVLSQAAVDSIDDMLMGVDSLGVQCLVVAVEQIENADAYRFATDLGNRFGVGGRDNLGVVVVLATVDRVYWIATGDGMEKFLPDAICKRIENRTMVPLLKEGDWDGAMKGTVRDIVGYIVQEPEITDRLQEGLSDGNGVFGLMAMILVAISIIAIRIRSRKERKCPNCGKLGLKITGAEKGYVYRKGVRYKTYIYTCKYCGHSVSREKIVGDSNSGGGFIGGTGGGSRSSGGGFSSFGGGSFSGGGAGGRF